MNEQLLEERKKSLLNVGSCNIHTLHNGFQKGLGELGEDASELIIAVYYFFHGWPLRLEDFEKVQDDLGLHKNHFLKHVTSRWLTLEQSAERIIQQWPALIKYFTSYIPKKRAALSKSASYTRIVKFLNNPTLKAEVHFVASSARIFTRFTGNFICFTSYLINFLTLYSLSFCIIWHTMFRSDYILQTVNVANVARL